MFHHNDTLGMDTENTETIITKTVLLLDHSSQAEIVMLG